MLPRFPEHKNKELEVDVVPDAFHEERKMFSKEIIERSFSTLFVTITMKYSIEILKGHGHGILRTKSKLKET